MTAESTVLCWQCGMPSVFWVHDAGAEGHSWEPGHEDRCRCGVEAICTVCEAERLRSEGFILLPRRQQLRDVAPAGRVRH